MRKAESISRMTADEYIQWLDRQPGDARYELVGGQVVGMSPERIGHARAKARVWRVLETALKGAGSECEAIIDGAAVKVDVDTIYEPDVVVNCGPALDDDAIVAPNPVVIVEVLSPSTGGVDTGMKFADYFRLPSLRHYLIVRADRRVVIHHARQGADGPIMTAVITGGALVLDPPGITVETAAFFER